MEKDFYLPEPKKTLFVKKLNCAEHKDIILQSLQNLYKPDQFLNINSKFIFGKKIDLTDNKLTNTIITNKKRDSIMRKTNKFSTKRSSSLIKSSEPESPLNTKSYEIVDDATIKDWNGYGWGTIT